MKTKKQIAILWWENCLTKAERMNKIIHFCIDNQKNVSEFCVDYIFYIWQDFTKSKNNIIL